VNANGKADLGRFALDVITNCDEIAAHSASDNWNIKSVSSQAARLW